MIQVNARWGGRGGGGRGGGRGGRGGGRSGGRGQAGTGRGGSFGRAGTYGGSRGSSRGGSRGHLGKGVYSTTSYGTHGRPGAPGSYNTSTIRGANGRVLSTSRAYGLARADGGFGQVGTGRGSFRSSARSGNSFGGRRGGGGGVSRSTAAVAPPSGGGDDGGDDSPTTPPGSGTERSLRIRNSPARRTAFGRGRRAQGSRRSLRIGRSVGGLDSGGSRSGITV